LSALQVFYYEILRTINAGEKPLRISDACNITWLSIKPAVVMIIEELKMHLAVVC
jgi:hypothetical protein